MRLSLRVSILASVIGATLGGAGIVSTALAADSAQQVSALKTYLIDFAEPGALHYEGGQAGIAATAPKSDSTVRFNAKSDQVVAYRTFLQSAQNQHVADLAALLGRELQVSHHFLYTHSGIAARLTAAEAAAVVTLPGIKAVREESFETQDTYRGPAFIGAPTIWGAALPGGPTNRGKGVILGILDSGANSAHPAFADDASCGFGPTDHKLKAVSCATTDGGGVCNGPTPEADAVSSSHGVHTAGTAGGNTLTNTAVPSPNLPAGVTDMSGVAPCASVNSYKVCNETNGQCSTAHSAAAVNNAIADGVDVINFSISGGTTPWTVGDNDRNFLDAVTAGIFVAASAGNTSATITSPIGQVNHRGPWVMTVAASTHDRALGAGLSAVGPGSPPANTQNIITVNGSTTTTQVPFTGQPIKTYPANTLGCTSTGGIAAGTFTGSVALLSRGTCSFTEKITNATNAGAVAVFIHNNTFGSINMSTTGAPATPAYSMRQDAGVALSAFINGNGATPTTASLVVPSVGPQPGDVLANFSFRGPTPAPVADLQKPDITGPGVNIYAPFRTDEGSYGLLSGTSMSGPHIAGSAALVRAVRPSWTPMEVKSALQMAAKLVGFKEDETSGWNIDDVGSGRVDLTKAADVGLVMNETTANFLAADPSGGAISVRALNIPSLRNLACTPSCTFTRTVTSKLAASATWNTSFASAEVGGSASVVVAPANFTIAPGATQVLTFTVTPGYGAPLSATAIAFGNVLLTPQTAGQSPVEHITVAISGTRDGIFKDGFGN